MDKEQWKGNVDLLILSVLRKGDTYGFSIILKIKELSEVDYELSEGTLYSALKRLERKELITSYWGNETQGGRRKYYTITPLGLEAHKQKLKGWGIVNQVISKINKE